MTTACTTTGTAISRATTATTTSATFPTTATTISSTTTSLYSNFSLAILLPRTYTYLLPTISFYYSYFYSSY